MRVKITPAEYAKLSPEFQAEYSQDGDSFSLSLDGVEDTGALRRAKDNEVVARKAAQTENAALKDQVRELTEGTTAQVQAEAAKHTGKIEKLTKFAQNALVKQVALGIATGICKTPSLLVPVIEKRLQADLDADEPATKVLDASGKVSKTTLDELKAELVANPEYRDIMLGNKASGGGASLPALGAGGPGSQQQQPNPQTQLPDGSADLTKLKGAGLVAEIKARSAARTQQA